MDWKLRLRYRCGVQFPFVGFILRLKPQVFSSNLYKIGDRREGDTIDEYLHAYYPDIEDQYRNEIYKLL